MKHSDLIVKTETELVTQLEALKKEQFNLRLKKSHSNLENVSQLRTLRRDVARVKLILSYMRGDKKELLHQLQPKSTKKSENLNNDNLDKKKKEKSSGKK